MNQNSRNQMNKDIRLLIHGGAGTVLVTDENRHLILENLEALKHIVELNYQSLLAGASAFDVAEQAVIELENAESFNAGRGAVLNSSGFAELDAAIMDGRTGAAGAIAAVQRVKNPISGARAIISYSQHVMLVGPHADQFCERHHVEMANPDYFITPDRLDQLKKAHRQGHAQDVDSLGTVGAVVRDLRGNLAAATSTGGKTNKTPGRVGDTPIIGAGTWADNKTCAVSATGDGEYFIRTSFAHGIAMLIEHKLATLEEAARQMLQCVADLGGEGGCIAIDYLGNYSLAFNSLGMYRGWVDDKGVAYSSI